MLLRMLVVAAALLGVVALSPQRGALAQVTVPSAINDPDGFAWLLFQEVNADGGTNDGRVVWETWKSANNRTDIFLPNGEAPPPWPPALESNPVKTLSSEPLQETMRLSELGLPSPEFDPNVGTGNEVRLNRAAFEFVVANELFHVDGQIKAIVNAQPLNFPVQAREIKAQWRRLAAGQDPARFHTARLVRNGITETWGLTSMHITTKDLPNWFWATWEHTDNPDREAQVPSRDRRGLPPALKGTKWQNYVLRGTQVDFTTAMGVPTILASSQIEASFQRTSSCITCHARATVATGGARLPVFNGNQGGFVGAPNPAWFQNNPPNAAQRFFQMDFVWSLVRAQRRP